MPGLWVKTLVPSGTLNTKATTSPKDQTVGWPNFSKIRHVWLGQKLAEAGDKERMEKEQLDEALKEVWDLRQSSGGSVFGLNRSHKGGYCFEAAAQTFEVVLPLLRNWSTPTHQTVSGAPTHQTVS